MGLRNKLPGSRKKIRSTLLSTRFSLLNSRLKSNKCLLPNRSLKAIRRSNSNSREDGLKSGNNNLLQDSRIKINLVVIEVRITTKDRDRTIPETITITLVQSPSTTEVVKDNTEAMVSNTEIRTTMDKEEATTMPTMIQISATDIER